MTGTRLLIVAIIVVFVIAFVITMVLLNVSAKKIIDAGFGGRRTFQMEVKRRLGLTPLQYRQGAESVVSEETATISD